MYGGKQHYYCIMIFTTLYDHTSATNWSSMKTSIKLLIPVFSSIKKRPKKTINYTEDAGCAITTGIPVKFGTAHGR